MATLFYSHSDFLDHDTGIGHPETPDRLISINDALNTTEFSGLGRKMPPVNKEIQALIRLVHSRHLIDTVLQAIPDQEYLFLDNDTVLSSGSGKAALCAVTAVCDAVDLITAAKADNAFCAVRPPGHHAEPNRSMGFCLFNNVAIAAEYARKHHHIERIAIVDFDVHHGNGTQRTFFQQANVLYISSHEMPNYPGTGYPSETGAGNIINIPLQPRTSGSEFKRKYSDIVFPALRKFKPELLFISAGFDAHKDDPLASIQLIEDDYYWVTRELMAIADTCCQGRVISVLEGGYNLPALAASVAAHVRALAEITTPLP